jgi:hypothetical protein
MTIFPYFNLEDLYNYTTCYTKITYINGIKFRLGLCEDVNDLLISFKSSDITNLTDYELFIIMVVFIFIYVYILTLAMLVGELLNKHS